MRKRNVAQTIGLLVAMLATGIACGKTIALWPIEYDAARGTFDYRCRIDPANDLEDPVSLNTLTNGTGWALPPNPDASVRRAFALNDSAVSDTHTTRSAAMLRSNSAGAYVVGTNDFTLEGFFKMNALPASGAFQIIASWIPNDNDHRFLFTIRRDSTGVRFNFWGALLTSKTDMYGNYLSADAVDALTNSWHHFALVYRHNNSEGKAATSLYIDGTLQVTKTINAINSLTKETLNTRLEFGGRTDGGNRAPIQLDYLRLSDEALDSSAFLNAGGAGTAADAHSPTVAYWKLSADEDGIDGSSSVGGYPLGDLWQSDHTNSVTLAYLEVSRESAFAGRPANTAMSPAATLPATNVGSLRVEHETVTLWHPTLGYDLTLTNSFTVEGWLKPERSLNYADDFEMLFNTRDLLHNGNLQTGWNFGLHRVSGKWVAYINAHDGLNVLCLDRPLSGALDEWTDWRHVAVSYDAETGNGVWAFYLDGELTGCVTNDVAPNLLPDNVRGSFWLGGRFAGRCFRGNVDYVRVSKAVLRPDQFLSAANGTAATDVLALWPLDVVNGIYMDGHDVMGRYNLQSLRAPSGGIVTYHASPDTADAPVITNPDASPAFQGNPAVTTGCVDFGDNSVRRQNFLCTRDSAALSAINARAGLTLEGYFKRTAVPDGNWDIYFGLYNGTTTNAQGTSVINLGVEKDRGFTVFENNWSRSSTGGAEAFSETVPDLTLNEWRHVAFTRTMTPTSLVWECFVNGISQGTSSERIISTNGDTPANRVGTLFVGGRHSSCNHFKGKVSSIRVSNRVLVPNEFLCATGPTPTDQETFGAWRTASAPLTMASYGLLTAPAHPFTVEYTAALADGAETLLAGTWYEAKKVGWKIVRAADGDVFVYARVDERSTPYATGTFGTVPSGRSAVAIIYNPYDGKGTWTLYTNGRTVGTVENLWTPSASTVPQPWPLTLGDTSMGALAQTRVTGAALGQKELLYVPGLMVIFR